MSGPLLTLDASPPAAAATPPARPLRVLFVLTTMPVGGAETLLVQLVRRLDRTRFAPQICCLKTPGPLGDLLAAEVPVHSRLLSHKRDLRVLPRLIRLLRRERIDAVVTVGTGGDKMFWGRLAARCAGTPIVLSALHSTGLPDRVEPINRLLAPLTDGFIAVAPSHGEYLTRSEGCPADKVFVVPNGVDTQRFRPLPPSAGLQAALELPPGAPVISIVAALRPEKHHELFLQAAARVLRSRPDTHFLIIGDGPRRPAIQELAEALGIGRSVRMLGSRSDVPELLALTDVLVLSSHMEANPVSILEAMACARPVVATDVGSVHESVVDGETGYLVPAGDADSLARQIVRLLDDHALAERLGRQGRQRVLQQASLERMVEGYSALLEQLAARKQIGR